MKRLLISSFVHTGEKWVHINKRPDDVYLVTKPEVCSQNLQFSGFDAESGTDRGVK